jgi:ribose 5-phosphate isomerase B
MDRKIALGCDHAAYEMKEAVKKWLSEHNYIVEDFGTDSPDSIDYPDIIHPLAKAINDGEIERGIIMCGSGIGVSIVANKYPNVRAALCWNTELAGLSRQHNNANILAVSGRFMKEKLVFEMLDKFLNTDFEGGRHQRRVEKIKIPD